MAEKRGILYIATGKKYVDEAIISAISCKKHNHHPIALITDSADYILPDDLFNNVIVKPAIFSYKDKLLLRHSPYEQTIFLDTDTYIADTLDDLFRILDYREFAVHQADEGYEFDMPEVSSAMPEFNTGVIAFKLTENVLNMLDVWEKSFDIIPAITTDQYHLRKTLYASEVKFAVFSSAYNFIIYYPNFIIQKVKVMHGRPVELLPGIADDLNNIRHQNAWRRTFYPHNNSYTLIYSNPIYKDAFKLIRVNLWIVSASFYRKLKAILKRSK